VDVERFQRELPRLFEDFPASRHPLDRRFRAVVDAVPGLASENNLALLNLAAGLVPPGETYVEVGSLRGTSLIGAALGTDADIVGIDDFSMDGSSRDELLGNLASFGVEHVTVLEGDVLELLRDGRLADWRVGVLYYDASHEYDAQLAALRLFEPLFAESALIVVDDADWESVSAATRRYLEEQPRARRLFDLPGKDKGFPWWWRGVDVLAWR
jgi:predicted O-methyltransferase YrrM